MLRRLLKKEEGAELVAFLILVPILLAIAMLIWQMFLFGHAMVVTGNAAREGARAAAACEGSVSAGRNAAYAAASGYEIEPSISRGSTVVAHIRTHVPVLRIPYFMPDGKEVWISATSRMKRERGPKCR